MNSWICGFLIGLFKIKNRLSNIIGMLALPILILIIGLFLPQSEINKPINIGLSLNNNNDGYTQKLLDKLQNDDDKQIIWNISNQNEIKQNVLSGKWLCGFILSSSFAEKLESENLEKLVTVVKLDDELLSSLIQERFLSALYSIQTPVLAANYSQKNNIAKNTVFENWTDKSELKQYNDMSIEVINIDGISQNTNNSSKTAFVLCKTLIAIFIFLISLLQIIDINKISNEQWFINTVPYFNDTLFKLGITSSFMLLNSLCAIFAWIISFIFFGSNFDIKELLLFISYFIMLTLWIAILSRYVVIRQLINIFLPFIPIICFVLSPIFIDITSIFPYTKLFLIITPPVWLLYAINGNALFVFLIIILIFLGIILIAKIKKPLNGWRINHNGYF